jgi:hypothetical protein
MFNKAQLLMKIGLIYFFVLNQYISNKKIKSKFHKKEKEFFALWRIYKHKKMISPVIQLIFL